MRITKTARVATFVSVIAYAYCFQKTVKPVLVDTSLCPDFADVLSGKRETQAQQATVIKFNETHTLSTNTTQCTVNYAFLDFVYGGKSTVYEKQLVGWELSPDIARFWDRNYEKIDATATQLVLVSCDLVSETDATLKRIAMPNTTNFDFVLQTTGSGNVHVLECRYAYCLLGVPTNGCMNSAYIASFFPSTKSVLVKWLRMIMLIRTPDTVMMQIQAIVTNQSEAMTTATHMFSKAHGMLVKFPSKCINEEETPCTQAQALARAHSIISGLRSIMQTPLLFLESVHKNAQDDALYDVNCRMFQLQPRTKKMQEYGAGFRKCPENTTQTGATNTFRDENGYVYKLHCIPCGINTYYSEDRTPAPEDVSKKQEMFITGQESNERDLHVNLITRVLTYFITSNSQHTTQYVEDEHSESVVDIGTTLELHLLERSAQGGGEIEKVMCEDRQVSFTRINASSVSFQVTAEYSGKIISVHIVDPDCCGSLGTTADKWSPEWSILPAIIFARPPTISQVCLGCPIGKFSGKYGAGDISECADSILAPPQADLTSVIASTDSNNNINARRNARTEIKEFMTYVEADGVYINLIKISTIGAVQTATNSSNSSQNFTIETWLDTVNLTFVREHAVSLQDSVLKIYDPQQQHNTRRIEVQTTLLTEQGPVILKFDVIRHPQPTSGDAVNWQLIAIVAGTSIFGVLLISGIVVITVTLCKKPEHHPVQYVDWHPVQQHVAHEHGYLPVNNFLHVI